MSKTRNPVAGNIWKYNKPKVVPDKKREPKQKHIQRVLDEFLEY